MALVACATAAVGVAEKSEGLGLPGTSRPVVGAVGRGFMGAIDRTWVDVLGGRVVYLFVLPFVMFVAGRRGGDHRRLFQGYPGRHQGAKRGGSGGSARDPAGQGPGHGGKHSPGQTLLPPPPHCAPSGAVTQKLIPVPPEAFLTKTFKS